MTRHSVPAILFIFLAGTASLFGLAEEKFGPDRTRTHPTTAQADWPAGLLDPETALDTLKNLTVPDNIILHNEIEGSTLKGSATQPTRKVWHARVDFDDATPAADFEHDLSTRITLWDKDNPVPIALGGISHEGRFHAAFSDAEIAELQTKKSRRNIYVPRYGQPGRSTALHSWPAPNLAKTKANAGVVKIPKPIPPE